MVQLIRCLLRLIISSWLNNHLASRYDAVPDSKNPSPQPSTSWIRAVKTDLNARSKPIVKITQQLSNINHQKTAILFANIMPHFLSELHICYYQYNFIDISFNFQ